MQVTENLKTVPAANHLDDIAVNYITEERIGTCGAEGASGDALGFESQNWAIDHDSSLEGLGDHCRSYILPSTFRHHDAGLGVEGDAPLALWLRTIQNRSAFGHRGGSPEDLWPIFSPLTLFFCVVNVSVTNVAAWRSIYVNVAAKTLWPQLKAMSSRRKGVLFDLNLI